MGTRADATGRPASVRHLTREIAADYVAVENASPPGSAFGCVSIWMLPPRHPLCQIWPGPSVEVRKLMVRATHLYRSLGVLVAEGGVEVASSLPVLGRTLLEVISQVDWLIEPVLDPDTDISAARVTARRAFLRSLAGLVDLQRESEDFEIPDLQEITDQVRAGKERGAELFGRDAVALERRNPDRWSIDAEGKPGKADLVNAVGKKIFYLGVRKSSHYHGPSMSAHGSDGAPIGTPVDVGDGVHVGLTADVETEVRWLWYYTVWYRYGMGIVAEAHGWDGRRIRQHDAEAERLFGHNVSARRLGAAATPSF